MKDIVATEYDLEHHTFYCFLTAKDFVANALGHNMIVKDSNLLFVHRSAVPRIIATPYNLIATHDSSQ